MNEDIMFNKKIDCCKIVYSLSILPDASCITGGGGGGGVLSVFFLGFLFVWVLVEEKQVV